MLYLPVSYLKFANLVQSEQKEDGERQKIGEVIGLLL